MTIEFQIKQLNLDIDELVDYIKQLEVRIIELERKRQLALNDSSNSDGWYWDH